jgi:Annexin
MLSVRDDRRSRSKSPSGRDRERSRSRDDRSPARKERWSSKYSPSGSENDSADDRRYKERRSSKHGDASDDDRKRSHKSSSKYRDDDSDVSDSRHKSSRSSRPSRRDESASDNERRRDKGRREIKKYDESDEDRRSGKKEKPSRKKSKYSESSESEGDPKSRKSKKDSDRNGQVPPYAQPPYGYPPGYVANYPPPSPGGYQDTRHMSFAVGDPRYAPPGGYMPPPQQPAHPRAGSFSGGQRYADSEKYQYAQPDQNVTYKYPDGKGGEKQYIKTYNARGEPQMIEFKGEYERKRPEKDKKYVDDKYERHDKKDDRKDKKYHDAKYGSSPDDVTRKMANLAVGGALGVATLGVAGRHASHDGGKPPASPLLEAYKGTYQSMSPMPSALVLSKSGADSDLSDLDLESDISVDSDDPNADLKRKIKRLEKEKAKTQKERAKKSKSDDHDTELAAPRSRQNSNVSPRSSDTHIEVREPRGRVASDASIISPVAGRRRVMFYDANTDAKKLAAALEGTHRPPNTKPLIEILPALSDDDIMALRLEYKTVAKVGGQGINIAKHIKMRVPGNLGKAAYATALGRWESEAYWANSWYQGGATRRELLIESLMGRTNSDIREIKNCFKDKRYNDDLEKCMKAELKADKFRAAILLALEERRMPESSPLDIKLVREDVQDLHHALSGQGGETAIINIVVIRSDNHLREVLKIFEKTYKVNFARAMIDKSRNLVGETLAHVLNGALNRPMRDALLLHQAIAETAPGKERAELLISRLVRLHWEPKHLEKVKQQYEARYRMPVEIAIKREVMSQMKTEEGRSWAEFCVELVRSSA